MAAMMEETFTVKDVSRLFGLSESRIRYWAQTGFINPSLNRTGRRFYSFQDLIGIKVSKDLLASGLSLQKVRKNLAALRQLLPEVDRPLSRLRVLSDGERMWVQGEDAAFDVPTGQLLLAFRTGELHDDVVRILDLGRPSRERLAQPTPDDRPSPDPHPHRTAYRWFLQGLELDDSPERDSEAADAYRRALELDPSLAAAHTNLGILHHRRGERVEARAHFERAIALDPDQPEARYDLANLYDEEGQLDLAIAEYRRVVAMCPEFGDAHFNLAVALEKVGSRVQAAGHFQSYLDCAGSQEGPWVRLARAHLSYLGGRGPLPDHATG
jgi:tetratricopeptide (TPR) repeat protein